MELEDIVAELCKKTPEAIGAILCDFEGEAVVLSRGSADLPNDAKKHAIEHVPRNLTLSIPVEDYLIRLAGAEPCALLRALNRNPQTGHVGILEFRYRDIDLVVHVLPNDYYLVLLLRRPSVVSCARQNVRSACSQLSPHIA